MEYGIIAWLVIGAIAGWLAGQVVKGGGFGLIVDIIVGIVGAVIGGFLASGDFDRRRPNRFYHRGFRRRGDPAAHPAAHQAGIARSPASVAEIVRDGCDAYQGEFTVEFLWVLNDCVAILQEQEAAEADEDDVHPQMH